MKLKEKLAQEFVQEFGEGMKCYLAGFEKAREMACQIEWNAAGNSEQLYKFDQIGEEEVKEHALRMKIGGKKFFTIIGEDVSDGYHTFNELYDHRNLLFLNLCLANAEYAFWKPDYDGHFVLYLETGAGQMSYHLGNELLPLIEGRVERDDKHQWDGHKSEDSICRLKEMANL